MAGFSLNTPHSVLLVATAGASVLAILWTRVGRAWALIQAAGYGLAFLIGTAVSAGRPQDTWLALNTPDHFLHLGLALLGGVLGLVLQFWHPPGENAPSRILPGAEPPADQRPPTPREEESQEPGK
ncbi:MAG: DUF4383 domain-containing protein [Actinomycetota bacterium]|nr:DUF4383 domain-containing protein [Actinomycetota bacterium]